MRGKERPATTSSEPLDLDHLEGVAMMADHGGRHWVHHRTEKGYPQRITREGDVVIVAECFEGPQYPPLFTDFITTFDPPTVLRLIELARGQAGDDRG